MFKQNTKYEILTLDGFKKFSGVNKTSKNTGIKITLSSGNQLTCTIDHLILTTKGFISANQLLCNDVVIEYDNISRVVGVEHINNNIDYYDPINVEQQHNYVSNNIISHNCEFLSSEALLIKSLTLQAITNRLKNVSPKFMIDNLVKFWEDIHTGYTYLIGVDPATGSGLDFTVISVFEFPSMIQVAEYRSNTMSSNEAYKILKKLLLFFQRKETTVYFSVENNGVGEGIISLFEADETQPVGAEFVSESGRGKRGMFTVSKTKMRACVNLRELIEQNNLHIRSPILLKELKTYVRKKGSYDHQPGSTSDCIAAVLIIIRLIEEIASYDQAAFDKLYASDKDLQEWTDDDINTFGDDEPLPISLG